MLLKKMHQTANFFRWNHVFLNDLPAITCHLTVHGHKQIDAFLLNHLLQFMWESTARAPCGNSRNNAVFFQFTHKHRHCCRQKITFFHKQRVVDIKKDHFDLVAIIRNGHVFLFYLN